MADDEVVCLGELPSSSAKERPRRRLVVFARWTATHEGDDVAPDGNFYPAYVLENNEKDCVVQWVDRNDKHSLTVSKTDTLAQEEVCRPGIVLSAPDPEDPRYHISVEIVRIYQKGGSNDYLRINTRAVDNSSCEYYHSYTEFTLTLEQARKIKNDIPEFVYLPSTPPRGVKDDGHPDVTSAPSKRKRGPLLKSSLTTKTDQSAQQQQHSPEMNPSSSTATGTSSRTSLSGLQVPKTSGLASPAKPKGQALREQPVPTTTLPDGEQTWLVKVPLFIAEKLTPAPSGPVGKVVITEDADPNSYGDYPPFMLRLAETEYRMQPSPMWIPAASLYVDKEGTKDEEVIVPPPITQQFTLQNLNGKPVVQPRDPASKQRKRTSEISLDKMADIHNRPVFGGGFGLEKEFKKEKRHRGLLRSEIIEEIIGAFGEKPAYNLNALVEITKQPKDYVLEILKEYANYRSATRMWVLKPEFRC